MGVFRSGKVRGVFRSGNIWACFVVVMFERVS